MAKIKIRYSMAAGATAPVGLTAGELAVNITQRRMFVGDTGGNTVELAGLSANNFTGLNTFAAGISAAGGVTFADSLSGTTAAFSRLVTAQQGISANGATLSGIVTAPTEANGTNNTRVATTAFVANNSVARVNGISGGITLNAGTNITITSSVAGGITIASSGTSGNVVSSVNGFTGAVGISGGKGITLEKLAGTPTIVQPGINYIYGGVPFPNYSLPTSIPNSDLITKDWILLQANPANPFVTSPEEMYLTSIGNFKRWIGGGALGSIGFTGTEFIPIYTDIAGSTTSTGLMGITTFTKNILDSGVTSFNGRTGAVQGVSSASAGTGISISPSGGTGAITITNIGVQSFNGSTGAISGVGSIVAGSNITITPTGGTGAVTINATVPTVNNGTLTMNTSGNGISGTQTFTANQSSAATFTVASNATDANTASTIVFRDASGNFSAGTITAALTGTASNASALGNTAASGWAQLAAANTFTALNTFNSGIKSNVYEPLTGGAGVTFGLLSGGGQGNIHFLASEIRVGGTSTLQGITLTTVTGVTLTVRPRHNLIVDPIGGSVTITSRMSGAGSGGTIPKIVLQNIDSGSGRVQIDGGNLYLGTRSDSIIESSSNIIFANPVTAFTTTLTAPNTASSDKLITLPNATGTVALDAAANTFTALQSFTQGISAAGGVTLASNIAVNGGSITTSATTGNVFNTTATTLNIGGAATTTNIATVASGLTLNIATGANGSDIKNIYIGTGPVGGGSARTTIGYNGGVIVSHGNGITLSDSAGGYVVNIRSATTNITGTLNASGSLNSTGLFTTSGGLSASGGVTFNTPIISTRLSRTSSGVFDTRTGSFSPAEADNGKIFVINISGKTTATVTLDGLSVGWRAKFLVLGGSGVSFTSTTGTVFGSFGTGGLGNSALSECVEVHCYATNAYHAS